MNKASVTLSVISHEQHSLVDALLSDLGGMDTPELARIVLTQNLPERPPAMGGAHLPPIDLVRNRTPKGFGTNHNAAFRYCNTEFFAIANPDIAMTHNPFPALISALRGGAGVAAPAVLEPDGRRADTARRLITPLELILRRLPFYMPPEAPVWFAGMFLVFRSDAFAAIGGFDEGYFMYCEDFDICARMRLAGWPVRYTPQVQVVHAAQQLSHRSLRHFRWHLGSLMRTWRSDPFWNYRKALASGVGEAPAKDESSIPENQQVRS